jgi:hypothetical protein
LYEALNRRDITRAIEHYVGPEIELHSRLVVEGEVFRGHEGFQRWFGSVVSVFPNWHADVVSAKEVAPATLICGVRISGQAEASRVPVAQMFWQLGRFNAQRLVWTRFFRTQDEALEAVGLSEQDA